MVLFEYQPVFGLKLPINSADLEKAGITKIVKIFTIILTFVTKTGDIGIVIQLKTV